MPGLWGNRTERKLAGLLNPYLNNFISLRVDIGYLSAWSWDDFLDRWVCFCIIGGVALRQFTRLLNPYIGYLSAWSWDDFVDQWVCFCIIGGVALRQYTRLPNPSIGKCADISPLKPWVFKIIAWVCFLRSASTEGWENYEGSVGSWTVIEFFGFYLLKFSYFDFQLSQNYLQTWKIKINQNILKVPLIYNCSDS